MAGHKGPNLFLPVLWNDFHQDLDDYRIAFIVIQADAIGLPLADPDLEQPSPAPPPRRAAGVLTVASSRAASARTAAFTEPRAVSVK
jgi:hypothetical protein